MLWEVHGGASCQEEQGWADFLLGEEAGQGPTCHRGPTWPRESSTWRKVFKPRKCLGSTEPRNEEGKVRVESSSEGPASAHRLALRLSPGLGAVHAHGCLGVYQKSPEAKQLRTAVG